MPIYFTYIARVNDGLPLVASFSHTTSQEDDDLQEQKIQAKKILKTINEHGNKRMSITTTNTKQFHYIISPPILYLTLTEASYPKKVIFNYLSTIESSFLSHIQSTHGPDYEPQLKSTVRPYAYIHYDPILTKHQRSYQDPNSLIRSDKLNQDLEEIHSIMKSNINSVLNRGEKLEGISNVSNSLMEESKKFSWGTKKLMWKKKLDDTLCVATCILFVLLVGAWKMRRWWWG